jgi:hypothetical protein
MGKGKLKFYGKINDKEFVDIEEFLHYVEEQLDGDEPVVPEQAEEKVEEQCINHCAPSTPEEDVKIETVTETKTESEQIDIPYFVLDQLDGEEEHDQKLLTEFVENINTFLFTFPKILEKIDKESLKTLNQELYQLSEANHEAGVATIETCNKIGQEASEVRSKIISLTIDKKGIERELTKCTNLVNELNQKYRICHNADMVLSLKDDMYSNMANMIAKEIEKKSEKVPAPQEAKKNQSKVPGIQKLLQEIFLANSYK